MILSAKSFSATLALIALAVSCSNAKTLLRIEKTILPHPEEMSDTDRHVGLKADDFGPVILSAAKNPHVIERMLWANADSSLRSE